MKVSKKWLEKFFPTPAESGVGTPTFSSVGVDKIADALTFHAFEIESVDKVNPRQSPQRDAGAAGDDASDEVLDVKVTPNRGHDCLSHRGIAKELSAILKLPLKHDPFLSRLNLDKKTDTVTVSLTTPLCKRYIAGYVKGVKVGPSPAWLKARLEAIGQRSINNVVDATNFVMFNTGQPLHAFDADKIAELTRTLRGTDAEPIHILVRNAFSGERMTTLDGKDMELQEHMLVIAAVPHSSVSDPHSSAAIGIAGVKGGIPAAIDESTKDIVIESANFDGVSVRKTAQALKLRTDASARFEQGLSPELAARGMEGMVEFVAHMIGSEVAGFVDVYPEPQKPMFDSVTVEQVNNVLGTSLTGADVADVFSRLGLPYKEESGVFEVQVPFERLDLSIPEDLIEEVGRIVGYDKIPATPLPPFSGKPEVNANFYASEHAREELVAQGYSEVYTTVFAEQGERVVLNKVDGVRPYLRNSLLPGLTEALARNARNKELLGLKEVKLFEIGTVWKDGKEMTMLGTISEKQAAQEKPLQGADAQKYEDLPISAAERFAPFSKYPYIVRDVAMWAAGADVEEARNIITAAAGPLAVRVDLFDRFEKEGKTSLAYRLIFQSFNRTLEDAEANAAMEKVYAALKEKGFEIR